MSRGSPTSTRLPESGKPARELAAQFLFKLVSRRYLKGSIILTSNKSYGEWGNIYTEPNRSEYPSVRPSYSSGHYC
jgi:hypothetical protein